MPGRLHVFIQLSKSPGPFLSVDLTQPHRAREALSTAFFFLLSLARTAPYRQLQADKLRLEWCTNALCNSEKEKEKEIDISTVSIIPMRASEHS